MTLDQVRTGVRLARQAWVVPAIGTALLIAALSWGAVQSAGNLAWLSGHQWWRAALRPDARWTLPVLLGLWLAALALYWWPRRHHGSHISVLALLSMVVGGVTLAEASFLPCAGGQAPVVAPFSWVLMLFTGSLEPRYGPGTGCPGQLPLALQFARILCLGATFVGVAAAATVLWRREIDRQKTRFLGELMTVTGLDEMTVALLSKFVTESSGRRVVLVEPDPNHPLLEEVRATGARVIIADPKRPDALRPVLIHLGRPAARWMFALHAGSQDNEEVLTAAREVLAAARHAEHHPVLVARIDDPRHADTWRGEHISAHHPWLEDALSPCETTAVFAVRSALERHARTLVVCGDTTLALAILIEAARCAWERNELRAAEAAAAARPPAGGGQFAAILIMADRAEDLRREFAATVTTQLHDALPSVTAMATPWRSSLLAFLDSLPAQDAADCVVLITDEATPGGTHEAGRVARLHPRTVVYVQSVDSIGGVDVVFDNLHQFRTGFLVDGVLPVDTWTRLARHNHEYYRLRWPVSEGNAAGPARQPWDDLLPFYREDNVRQVRQVLSSVVGLGRVWRPLRAVPPGSIVELTESELTELARAEHARWYARRLTANWRPPDPAQPDGAAARRRRVLPRRVRADGTRVNTSMVPWEALPEARQRQNVQHIASILAQLEVIGYAAVLPPGGPPRARLFQRCGEVRAVRLTAPRDWETGNGSGLLAEAGDWNVCDEHGHERTVKDPAFRASHRHLAGDRWVRTGTARAWQVTDVTTVHTLEGPAVAAPGDWIVEGRGGERWPVRAGHFEHGYVPSPDGVTRQPGGHGGGRGERSPVLE